MKFENYLSKQQDDTEYVAAEQELEPFLDIANAVLRQRLAKGWSQAELAKRAGTKQANISHIENGLANPTIAFLQKLARALGTELQVSLKAKESGESTQVVDEIRF
jgi:transcriptional regulator with XRE-family HTH domain